MPAPVIWKAACLFQQLLLCMQTVPLATSPRHHRRPIGSTPGREISASVTEAQVREIAEAKMVDLNANDIDAAMNIIKGSARSMGYEVV